MDEKPCHNRDALIKIAMDAIRIDAQLADVMITSTLADFASNMRLDGLKNAEEALLKTGLISKKVNVEAFYVQVHCTLSLM